MKNSIILKFTVLFLFSIIISCKKEPIEIKIIGNENSHSDTLIFNSKDTIITQGTISSVFLSPSRMHTFTLNNSKPIAFWINKKGGILNIHNNEFVVYNVEYNEDDPYNEKYQDARINLLSGVMIDSFLVVERSFENQLKDPKELDKIISEISTNKNGNYRSFFDDKERLIEGGHYDTINNLNGFQFKKVGKDKIFIEKFWDYDIDEKIPEEIAVTTRRDNVVRQNRIRKAIILDKNFLLNAKFLESQFYIIDIRNKLK